MGGQVRGSNIAGAINAAHAGVEAAKREGAKYAVECGRLLGEAKTTVPHGSWDAWLRLNTTVSPRTAQLYMRIARHVEGDPAKAQRVAGLSLREAMAEAAGTKRATVARAPISRPTEASDLGASWRTGSPEEKEQIARDLCHEGMITREQRNAMIKAAWHDPTLSKQDRAEAGRRAAQMMADVIPHDELRAMLPKLRQVSAEDIAIAMGDVRDARRRAGQPTWGASKPVEG